jgi:hypothetical protein
MNEGTAMSHQFRTMSAALVSLTMLTGSAMPARSADPAPLQLEAKICSATCAVGSITWRLI